MYPLSNISLYLFTIILNLSFSIIMFYLRSKGGTESHTKGQLWGLTLLAFLFLANGIMLITEAIWRPYEYTEHIEIQWYARSLWCHLTIFTGVLLLAFGLTYPRPVMRWSRMKYLIPFVLLLGFLLLVSDVRIEHTIYTRLWRLYSLEIIYIPAVFLPVFIWLSQYSRLPSKEGRMMFTIFIWGFIFSTATELIEHVTIRAFVYFYLAPADVIYLVLLAIFFFRLVFILWEKRKAWAIPEWINVIMITISCGIGLGCGLIASKMYGISYYPWNLHQYFLVRVFGWAVVRPALFSYGLLRYRLLGTQVKAENALAAFGAVLLAGTVGLIVMNLIGAEQNHSLAAAAFLVSLMVLYPCWRLSQRVVTRLLPMSAGAEGVSMKERRDTYYMALQTAVVQGQIDDKEDMEALEVLRKELGVTEREHDLLMESIALHEVRRAPKKEIEEAYLMFRDGRLLAHSIPRETEAKKDTDIVAGMLTAITEYVKEAMTRKESARAGMDTISYGASSLVIETEGNLVLAILLNGVDDVILRHSMRDTLADINDKYGKSLKDNWDGDLTDIEGIDKMLDGFVRRQARH
jgi:hypothetical protein